MRSNSSSGRPLTSIVSYSERGEGGNNRYRGNCSPKLIEDLISFLSQRKSAIICAAAAPQLPLPVNGNQQPLLRSAQRV